MDVSLQPDTLTDYAAASLREWLVTNGAGAYASASVAGANTRRYHGLLVAAVGPPLGRAVVLSRCEETVSAGGNSWQLGTNEYPGVIHPDGYHYVERFDISPTATFFYRLHRGLCLRKRVWMARGANATYVEYSIEDASGPVELTVAPLVCCKSYHTEMHRREGFPTATVPLADGAMMLLDPAVQPLRVTMAGADWRSDPCWYYNFEHARERERGFDWTEDLYCPGELRIRLGPGESATLVAALGARDPITPEVTWAAHLAYGAKSLSCAWPRDDMERALHAAADAFVIDRRESASTPRSTIVAGYHWFSDWGRDTMISLPGLCLVTGRYEVARDILLSYARHLRDGLIPNRFPDGAAEPEYNTADGTLWFVEASRAYVATAADGGEVLRALWPALTSIVAHHLSGTLSGIGVDGTDGLLCAGGPDTQLTWMDARVDGQAVTPRCGKPVEINALWYSALCFLAEQAEQAGADGTIYARLAERARSSFPEVFGRGDGLGLWDVIAPDGTPDPAIRPNQIIAAALVNSPLCADQRREVVDVVERELLTPFGLRTLARSDPSYRGRYAGTPSQRDSAYHQGTVWPWLLGPFVDAHLAVHGDCARARSFLIPFRAHLLDAGVGFISEVFDGDPPHTPGGCIAQAWSVAEVLRAWRSTLPR